MSTPTLQKICTVPTTPVPAPGSVGAYLNCDITVPESQLYFSRVKFSLTAAKQTCDVVYFQPLSYQASDMTTDPVTVMVMAGTPPAPSPMQTPGPGFVPQWSAHQAYNCNPQTGLGALPIECFSGPAIDLVPGFPDLRSLSYTPAWQEKFSYSWTARSAHQASRFSNRWTAYNANPSSGVPTTDGVNGNYVANTMRNWLFQCTSSNSDVRYQFSARIIPDSSAGSLGPGAPRWLGW